MMVIAEEWPWFAAAIALVFVSGAIGGRPPLDRTWPLRDSVLVAGPGAPWMDTKEAAP
jgi:hypothetical protein